MVAGFLTCHASAFAQNDRISLTVNDSQLSEVFQQIEKLSGYMFIYQSEDLMGTDRITLAENDATLSSILDKCLANTGLTYTFRDNLIIIRNEARQQADEKRVTGTVVDTKGHPLPGVAVIIKGTTLGVSTDHEGKFAITLPDVEDIRLIFSFIGMRPEEIAYAGQKEINVTLHEEATEIDEVVVTGYQVVDRRKNTSAVTSVRAEDIMIPSVTSIDKMLEGQVPDLMFMSNSGEVGVVPRIRIRGTSTLIGNREPLWVVDGIIVQDPVDIAPEELNDPDYINRIGNAIAGLNPQDIERLDILKDAAATAIYGTKAANGVIVITTKKGRVGRPVVEYSMTTTFRQRPRYTDRKINLMNSKERIQFSRELFEEHYVYPDYVNLVGYEGYCYVNPANNRRYAEITPIFKVRRLEDSSVTSLDADFYVKTSINAEDYLGIRKFSQPLDIPRSVKERTVKGRTTHTRIAEPPYEGFAIMLGMSLTEAEKAKAGKMFDIDYRYLSAAELAAQNEPETETVYLEVGPDEEVVYSEAEAKPVVVKKGQLKTPCQD